MLPYASAIVAEALFQALDRAAAANDAASLAIPGGRSPAPVLTALAGMLDERLRRRLHLLWLDERAVAPGHADRNDAPTLAAWSAGGALPAHVHPMPAERDDLAQAARDYAATLATATGGRGLDACLVGMGEDGHCASLFPRHPALRELDDCVPVLDSPKPPPRRLTLTLPALHRAGLLAVLVIGEAKGGVARQGQEGPDEGIPISLLPRERTLWYVDDAAAVGWRRVASRGNARAR